MPRAQGFRGAGVYFLGGGRAANPGSWQGGGAMLQAASRKAAPGRPGGRLRLVNRFSPAAGMLRAKGQRMPEINREPTLQGSALPWLFGCLFVLIAVGGLGYVLLDGDRYVQAARMTQARAAEQATYLEKDFFKTFDSPILAKARDSQTGSCQETSSYYRALIHESSVRAFAVEYRDKISVMYSMVEDFLAGKGPKPLLKCDSRAYFLRNILFNIGIESRIVHGLCLNNDGRFIGHTFLEVLDKDSNSWVVHDPYFNMSYVDKKTGRLAGLMDLCRFDIDDFAPTADSLDAIFHERKDYFSRIYTIVIYDNRELGTQSVVVFNTRKLGITTMAEFFQAERFSALREYIEKIWYDYVWIDV